MTTANGGNMKTKCQKHPKYNGRKAPKYECACCANIYFTLKTPRVLPMATKVVKSKKIYNRKRDKWR
jgi:hypothetical protein